MAQTVIFPKLGQTMEEGAIVKWLKREGDKVAKGDILFEIETDKANLEVESFFEGTLLKVLVKEGVTVPVNTAVGFVGEPGEKLPDVPVPAKPAPPEAGDRKAEVGGQKPEVGGRRETAGSPLNVERRTLNVERVPSPHAPSAASTLHPPPETKPPAISPRARAMCREAAVGYSSIPGSGPNGRIVEKDVKAYLAERQYASIRITPAAKKLAAEKEVDILGVRGSGDGGRIMVEDVERALRRQPKPLSRMRQVIARRLTESKQSIPHFYVTVTADVTEVMKLRAELKARGASYSLNDFVLSATIQALDEFPAVNSSTDGQSASWRGDVDLGMAVSLENGLVVPVIRAAQRLSLAELRDASRALAEKARGGKLTPDEMTGGGFTVSNMGMLDIDAFAAIINPGESGILAVGSAREEPVVFRGQVAVRTRMALTLSADHRMVDGALGAHFVNAIKRKLEDAAGWRGLV